MAAGIREKLGKTGEKVSNSEAGKLALEVINSEARAKAKEGNKKTATEAADIVVKSSGKSALDGQESLAKTLALNLDNLRDMSPVASLTGNEMNDRGKRPSEQIRSFFSRVGSVFRNGFGTISFGEYGVGGMLNHRPLNRAKMVSLTAVPSVIQNGRIISDNPNWKGRGYRSVIFAAPATINGTSVYIAAVVNQNPDGKFYLNECVDSEGNYIRIEKSSPDDSKSGVTVQDGVTATPEEQAGNGERANQTDLIAVSDVGTQSPLSDKTISQLSSEVKENGEAIKRKSDSSLPDNAEKSVPQMYAQDARSNTLSPSTISQSANEIKESAETGNKKAATEAAESTAVNDDPRVHTAEQQELIEEYKRGTDLALKAFIKKARSFTKAIDKNALIYTLKTENSRAIQEAGRITGVNTEGFSNIIDGSTIQHIDNRHGENGKADRSMANIDDMARIGYVLDNFTDAEILAEDDMGQEARRLSWKWRNRDNTPAPMVRFSMPVNGTYYVVEAVPNSKRKIMAVVSAYMTSGNKKGNTLNQELDLPNNSAGSVTPEAVHDMLDISTDNISQPVNEVKDSAEEIAKKETATYTHDNPPAASDGTPLYTRGALEVGTNGESVRGLDLETSAERYGVDEATLETVKGLCEATGAEAVFYESDTAGENGFYKDGIIHINTRSGNPAAQVFSHELTHSLEASGFYEYLRQHILSKIKTDGGDLEQLRADKKALYERHGTTLETDSEADFEIVAEYVENHLLSDEAAIKDMVKEQRSLGETIKRFIDRVLAKLGNKNAADRAWLAKVRDIYLSALEESQTRSGEIRQNRAEMEHIRDLLASGELSEAEAEERMAEAYSAEADLRGDYNEGREEFSISRTENNEPFVEVEQDILDGVPKEKWVTTVKENLKKRFPNEITVGNNKIKIDGQSRREMTYSGYMQWLYNNNPDFLQDKLRATNNADEIIRASTNWINEGINHPRNDKIVDFARGEVLLRVGNNNYSAEVVVGTRRNGDMVLYDILNLKRTLFNEKKTDTAISTNSSPRAARSTVSVFDNSISTNGENVNDGNRNVTKDRGQFSISETEADIDGNKKRTRSWMQGLGLQLPSDTNTSGSMGTITYHDGKVKIEGVPFEQYMRGEAGNTRDGQFSISEDAEAGTETNAEADPQIAESTEYEKATANLPKRAEGQFSISDTYADELNDWDRKGRPEKKVFVLGETGEVLQGLGAMEQDIYLRSEKINRILADHPEMTMNEIRRIPEILDDPVLVLKSRNEGRSRYGNSRLVMFGTVKNANGSPVMCILDLKPTEGGFLLDGMQKVNSAYVKTFNPVHFVENSEVLYADKKRTIPLLRAVGFNGPTALAKDGSIGSIAYDRDAVNLDGAPFNEVVRISENDGQFSISEAETEQATYETITAAWPRKARNYLENAVGGLVNDMGKALDIPTLGGTGDYMAPFIKAMSVEYFKKGEISETSMNEAFEEIYKGRDGARKEFYDKTKNFKDALRSTTPKTSAKRTGELYRQMTEKLPELFPEYIKRTGWQKRRIADVLEGIEACERKNNSKRFKEAARNDFLASVNTMQAELRAVKSYGDEAASKAEAKEAAKIKNPEELLEAYDQLKQTRISLEKAKARNLLTEGDKLLVGRLLRGEIGIESVDGSKNNLKGIKAVFEAAEAHEQTAKALREYNAQIKSMRRARAEGFLETMLTWKDKRAGILYERETAERNIRDIIKDDPKLAERMIAAYFTPVHQSEANSTRMKREYRNRVRELKLSREVTAGNEVSEAYAVQFIGEAEDNIRMLEARRGGGIRDGKSLEDWQGAVSEFWKKNPNLDKAKIDNAVKEFKGIYDELFSEINKARVRNGYEPINYRSGYFPHFEKEGGEGLLRQLAAKMGIDTKIDNLPTTINGLTHTFKPGITWFSNAQQRKGYNTAYDALEGFDRYIEGAASVIWQTDNIQNLRALATQIRYSAGDDGIKEQIEKVEADATLNEDQKRDKIENICKNGQYALSNFVVWLDEYTNLLANKKSRHDRGMEASIGRRSYQIMKNFESKKSELISCEK